jgi:hypothetical protein
VTNFELEEKKKSVGVDVRLARPSHTPGLPRIHIGAILALVREPLVLKRRVKKPRTIARKVGGWGGCGGG